jgi:hypothetical protein
MFSFFLQIMCFLLFCLFAAFTTVVVWQKLDIRIKQQNQQVLTCIFVVRSAYSRQRMVAIVFLFCLLVEAAIGTQWLFTSTCRAYNVANCFPKTCVEHDADCNQLIGATCTVENFVGAACKTENACGFDTVTFQPIGKCLFESFSVFERQGEYGIWWGSFAKFRIEGDELWQDFQDCDDQEELRLMSTELAQLVGQRLSKPEQLSRKVATLKTCQSSYATVAPAAPGADALQQQYLRSYVDVVEYATLSDFPTAGAPFSYLCGSRFGAAGDCSVCGALSYTRARAYAVNDIEPKRNALPPPANCTTNANPAPNGTPASGVSTTTTTRVTSDNGRTALTGSASAPVPSSTSSIGMRIAVTRVALALGVTFALINVN